MYDKQDIIRILRRNLNSEIKAIQFYVNNASKLDYSRNKAAIEKLGLESFDHAKMIAKELIRLEGNSKKATKKAKQEAIREEKALQDIYGYELSRTTDPKVKSMLKKLVGEERVHEERARQLK